LYFLIFSKNEIKKFLPNFILMLDKLLILDPKPGDLTMSRFVDIKLK